METSNFEQRTYLFPSLHGPHNFPPSLFPGANATITCKISSVPRSRVRWYHGNGYHGIGSTPSESTATSSSSTTEASVVAKVLVEELPKEEEEDGPETAQYSFPREILNNSVSNRGEQVCMIFFVHKSHALSCCQRKII